MKKKLSSPNEGINAFTLEFVFGNLQDLEGKMLTIVDACISERQQNKAIKDLVRKEFGKKISWFGEVSRTDYTKNKHPELWMEEIIRIK